MAVTKEILLRGPEEQAAYERARELAEYRGCRLARCRPRPWE